MSRAYFKPIPSTWRGLFAGLIAAVSLSLLSTPAFAVQNGEKIDPPQVLLDAGVLQVQAGQADEQASAQREKMSWAAVEKSVEPAPWPQVNPKPAQALSPVAADLLVQAEQASRKGEVFRAIQVIREAHALEPEHPQVARALGLAYAQSGNLTRAAAYLRPVAAADRADAEALLILARHASQSLSLEQVLADCIALEKIDGGQVLADRYRAAALHRLGYTAAAIDRLASVVKAIDAQPINDDADRPDTIRQEIGVLQAMSPRLRIQLGDLYLKTGQYDQASEAYSGDLPEDPTARHALVARRIYLALLRGDQNSAIDQAIAVLGSDDVRTDDAQLVAYLVEQGVPTQAIAGRINALLEQKVVLPRLVALAMVAEKAVVLDQLGRWLRSEPLSQTRLQHAVTLVSFDDDTPADAEPLADLLVILAGQFKQSPDEAFALARAAVGEIKAPVTLLRAMQRGDFPNSEDPYLQLIAAVAFETVGRQSDAAKAYQALLPADDALSEQVRLPLVRLQLALGMTDEPRALLGEPDLETNWEAFDLSLRAMAAAGDARDALAIIDRYIKARGKELKSDVLRIELIAMMGQPQEACNLLLRLISSHPEQESLYLLGLDIAYDYRAFFSRITDADRMRRAFLARLISNRPESALSRIGMAQNIMSNPTRIDEAERLLLKVLQENPEEVTAMSILVDLYDERGDEALASAMHERYASTIGPGVTRAILVAERAVAQGHLPRAVEVIEQTLALEKQGVLPGRAMTGNDVSVLLHHLEAADPDRDTDGLYLEMVRRFPDDAGLNNALGYRWTVQDKNLLQAKAMIERALQQEPSNHSLLDSLAWVYYKLGDFEKAYTTQSQALMVLKATTARFPGIEEEMGATIAILNDHMGDILYKLEDPRKALTHWREAGKHGYSKEDMLMDPELRTFEDRLDAKIQALANEEPVPVAAIPGPESHGPEGHPADKTVEDAPAGE